VKAKPYAFPTTKPGETDLTTPKDELPERMAEMFDRLAEPFHTELMEQSARLSAQRYLLEMLYAQQFLNQPKAFEEFMDGATTWRARDPARQSPCRKTWRWSCRPG
jgi:hypothetical protein